MSRKNAAALKRYPFERRGGGRRGRSQRSDKTPLNEQQERYIWRAYVTIAAIRIGVREFKDRLFGVPFEVTIGRAPRTSGRAPQSSADDRYLRLKPSVMKHLIRRYWMPWIADVHDRLKAFGICPYYFEPVEYAKKTHFVPVVPEMYSGYIERYYDGKRSAYAWTWDDEIGDSRYAGKEDPDMLWHFDGSPPSVTGEYTSDVASILSDWFYVSSQRRIHIVTSEKRANPLHVTEFAPNISAAQNAYMEGSSSSTFTGTYVPSRTPTPLELMDAYAATQKSHGYRDGNEDVGMAVEGTGDNLMARVGSEAHAFQNQRLRHLREPSKVPDPRARGVDGPPNTWNLDPYRKYVASAPPQPPATDLMRVMEYFNKLVAAVVDFPLESIMNQTGQGSAGRSETLRAYVVARLRSRAKKYEDLVQTTWLQAYAPMVNRERSNAKRLFRGRRTAGGSLSGDDVDELNRRLDVDVFFPRTPYGLTQEDLDSLYERGMVDEEQFFRFAVDVHGLPLDPNEPPPTVREKLPALYDAEAQHAQLVRWLQEEKRLGLDGQVADSTKPTAATAKSVAVGYKRKAPGVDRPAASTSGDGSGGDPDAKRRKRTQVNKTDTAKS